MWCPTELTMKEEEDCFSLASMAHVLGTATCDPYCIGPPPSAHHPKSTMTMKINGNYSLTTVKPNVLKTFSINKPKIKHVMSKIIRDTLECLQIPMPV